MNRYMYYIYICTYMKYKYVIPIQIICNSTIGTLYEYTRT